MQEIKCRVCGEKYAETERIEDYPKIPVSVKLCGSCIEDEENGYQRCASCDAYFLSKQGMVVDRYKLICPECVTDNAVKCKNCGQLTIVKPLSGKRELDDLCYDCETERLYRDYISSMKFNTLKTKKVSFNYLKKNKTVPIMSQLRHSYGEKPTEESKQPIDILLVDMHTYNKRMKVWLYDFSLIVIYSLPSRISHFAEGTYKMYEFVKTKHCEWNTINKARSTHIIELPDKKIISVWNKPVNIEAVTDSDKDFGQIWRFGELEEVIGEYGQTSSFYIIGSIKENIE